MGSGFSRSRSKQRGQGRYDVCAGVGASGEKHSEQDITKKETVKVEEPVSCHVCPEREDGIAQPAPDSKDGRIQPAPVSQTEINSPETNSLEKLIETVMTEETTTKVTPQTDFNTSLPGYHSKPEEIEGTAATESADTKHEPNLEEVVMKADGDSCLLQQDASNSSTSTECNTSKSASDSGIVSEDDCKISTTTLADGGIPSREDRRKSYGRSADQAFDANVKFFTYPDKTGCPKIKDSTSKTTKTFDDFAEIALTEPDETQVRDQMTDAVGGQGIQLSNPSTVDVGKKFSRKDAEMKLKEPNMTDVTSEKAEFDVRVFDHVGNKYVKEQDSVKEKLDAFMEAEIRFAERRSHSKDRATYLREMRDKIRQKTEAKLRKNLGGDF